MASKHGPIPLAILSLIAKTGSVNFLEVEHAIGPVRATVRLGVLLKDGYVKALPKERGQLKRYALTKAGALLVGHRVQEQKRLSVLDYPAYTPAMFTPTRAGAMAAFAIPSRGF